ncbi:circularly permutated ras protein 1 [Plakobranchus ocellatus]|uniref:Circularly permutated ras protein 1 n=1 Tax=Plakobranchus ocellatus TaxID=259542 RepID=A0AAV3X7Y8_9GAST|nr:circularly permutated ras protein 1 [Plakobranchus ocellatus]
MNFASEYVLADSDVEYESMCEEEFNQGMHVSDSDSSDSDDDASALRRSLAPVGGTRSPKKRKHLRNARYHWRRRRGEEPEAVATSNETGRRRIFKKADTNIVSVSFDTLLSPGNMFAGDPVPCPSCSAILSHISKLEGQESKVWQCEFCGKNVPVDLELEEIPGTEDVTYLLAPAPFTASTSMAGLDRSLVVFCVDTSGSMCVTSEISGKVKLRGNNQLRRLESFNEGNESQFLPSQLNHRVTYVSRLQAMQAAVDHQLSEMAMKHPDRRVALVAFNNEVTIMGDGSQQEIVVAGDKLGKLEQLDKVTEGLKLPEAIKTTRQVLGDKVYSLEEGGATALGPALIVAINMASSHPGSKVILCTDGKANIGLGRLEGDGDKDERAIEQEALEFYTQTAEEAAKKGVTVSVITIQGTDCKLVHLGTLADKTGGQVNIVDCLKLTEEFGNILADPIIATKVKATFLLHKQLYVVDDADPDKQDSKVEQNVGNVKTSSTITFEFAKRRATAESSKKPSKNQAQAQGESSQQQEEAAGSQQIPDEVVPPSEECMDIGGATAAETSTAESKDALQEFPFQLQIEYMDAEGNKALRVITRKLPATTDRSVTERAVNLEVLGAHAAKKSADLALQGQYSRSRGVALMNQRLAWRQAHSETAPKADRIAYKNIFGKIKSMENCLQQRQMMEIQQYGHTKSDSEDDDEDVDEYGEEVQASRALKKVSAQKQSLARSMVSRILPLPSKSRKKAASKHRKLHSERSAVMDDNMANMIYKFRSVGQDEISSAEPVFKGQPGASTSPEASSGESSTQQPVGKSGKKSSSKKYPPKN